MNSQHPDNRRTVRNLLIFSALMITLGWLAWGLESLMDDPSAEGMGMGLWVITPLVVSFLLRAFAGDGWQDLGLKPAFKDNGVWYAVSLLVYPACAALVLVIGAGLGAVTFPGFSGDEIGSLVEVFAAGLVSSLVKNIFEEFGWRGYLAPKLYTFKFNTLVAHGLVGIVWAAWHLPYYLVLLDESDVKDYTSLDMPVFLPLLFVGLIAASIVYGEIRIRTGSVWPAVVMHTMSNALITALILEDNIDIKSDWDALVTPGPEGILMIGLFALIGIAIYRRREQAAVTGVSAALAG
ncbi:MAG: CPBP family intramembrane metalloprotease [Anaerolineae bacterium]|nr:CPBP family intramembrane metalloprotease [Anaerolineae bacterium]